LGILARASESGYFGEPVSQLAHALQCAHFARRAGGDDELVLAALLHDIGHLVAAPDAPQMEALGVVGHEAIGAEYLRARGFSTRVAELVRGHVQAKRYLTAADPAYLRRLSPASRRTLDFQGGPMRVDELAAFACDPLFADKLRLRRFDEAAKQTELAVEPCETYRPLILLHLSTEARER
jgi:phosphonate degradation associated HDIG domain protein